MAQPGLHPDRVIYAEVGDEKSVLACFEEGLRHGDMAGVVGEVAKLSMTASRGLQLVAESSGTIAIAIRRWRRMTEASTSGNPDDKRLAVRTEDHPLDYATFERTIPKASMAAAPSCCGTPALGRACRARTQARRSSKGTCISTCTAVA